MISPSTNTKIQEFTAWSGVVYIILMMIGMWPFAQYFPSQPATWSAEQVATMYRENTMSIRIGMVFVLVASMFYVSWTAILAKLLARIEGKPGILCYSQIIAGTTNVLLTAYPGGWWLIASFRPERNPEITQMLHDTAWLQFLGVITPFYFVVISLGIAALCDSDKNGIFPRWTGYFNVWFLVTLCPLNVIFFFKDGPFALNGVFGFYLPFIIFWLWFVVMTPYVIKAAKQPD